VQSDQLWEPYRQNRIPYGQLSLANICGEWRPEETRYIDLQPGPVLHWLPRRADIERFTCVAEAVSPSGRLPTVVDVGAGSGLLGYLLASTGRLSVEAVEPDAHALGVGAAPATPGPASTGVGVGLSAYAHPHLALRAATCADFVRERAGGPVDVVVCSWMPARFDLAPEILRLDPSAIIYVRRDFAYLASEQPEHLEYHGRFALGDGYRLVGSWRTPSEGDVLDFLNACFEGALPVAVLNDNLIEVHVKASFAKAVLRSLTECATAGTYPWELETLEQIVHQRSGPPTLLNHLDHPAASPYLDAALAALMTVQPVR